MKVQKVGLYAPHILKRFSNFIREESSYMNELLNAIDVINESVNDSELSVLESLISVYDKSIMIIQESSDDADLSAFDIFQEGEILDQAKGNSSESLIKRILLFLPRLIKAILQRLFKSSKATEKSIDQAVEVTEQKKNNNEPCYFRIKLIIDPNNLRDSLRGEIPGTKHRMSRVMQYASEIENINQQTSQTEINDMVRGINNHGIEVLKTDIEDLKKAKSNMHTFTYTNWDEFEKALKHRQQHYGMTLGYDKQTLSDINDQIQDITKYADSDPEFAKRVGQLVIAIKNLCKSYEECILLWEECMNDDMKRINAALGISQENAPQPTPPESGVGRKENNSWDPKSVQHIDVELLKRAGQQGVLKNYMHGSHFQYYGEHKYPSLPKDVRDNLFALVNILEKEKTNFDNYKKHLDILYEIFDIPEDRVISLISDRNKMEYQGDLGFSILDPSKVLKNDSSVRLYHTASISGLTELKPTFRSDRELFPTRRVYFGYNKICSRFGGTYDPEKYNGDDVIYVADPNAIAGKQILTDPALRGGTACFVETDVPIPCHPFRKNNSV